MKSEAAIDHSGSMYHHLKPRPTVTIDSPEFPSTGSYCDDFTTSDSSVESGSPDSSTDGYPVVINYFTKYNLGGTGPNVVAIDNKIEQAMDLVKTHLMYAVREEVEVLRAKITDLEKKVVRLEKENALLREHASPEVLAQLVPAPAPVVVSSAISTGPAPNLILHGGNVPPPTSTAGNPLVGVFAGNRSPSDPVGGTLPPGQLQQQ